MSDTPESQGIALPSPDMLSNAIGTLMANPQLLNNITKAIEKSGLISSKSESEETEDKPVQTNAQDSDIFSKLGAIMSSISNVPKNSENNTEQATIRITDTDSSKSEPAGQNLLSSIPPELISKLPLIMSLISGGNQGGAKSKKEAEREALLCALKPYLTREKVETIDKIIQISRLGDIFKLL